MASSTDNTSSTWVVDSGASKHLTNTKNMLLSRKKDNTEIIVAKNGETIKSECIGNIETKTCNLTNVLYVPELTKNLMSVNIITEKGGEVTFTKDKVIIKKEDTIIKGNKILQDYMK